MRKSSIVFILVGLSIIGVLFMAPPETTKHVPKDDIHNKFYDIVKADGKKAAEKFCEDCHNADDVPFPADHPEKFRCLFCHKITF